MPFPDSHPDSPQLQPIRLIPPSSSEPNASIPTTRSSTFTTSSTTATANTTIITTAAAATTTITSSSTTTTSSAADRAASNSSPKPSLLSPGRQGTLHGGSSGDGIRAGHSSSSQQSRQVRTRSDAVLINFLGNHNRPDIAQEAYERPLGYESEDEAGSSSPSRNEMTAAYEQSSIHHLSRHGLNGYGSHPLRDDQMSSPTTRPRSGGGSAPLNLIMNTDSAPTSQPSASGPRLDTSQQTLAHSSVGAHLISGPTSTSTASTASSSSAGPSISPRTSTILPPVVSDRGRPLSRPFSGRELPPLTGGFPTSKSALPSPASDLSSARTPQLPSITKQLSAATSPSLAFKSQPSPPTSLVSPHHGPHSAVSPPSHYGVIPPVRAKPLSPQSEVTTPASAFSTTSFQSPNGSVISGVGASGGDAMQVDGGRVLPPPTTPLPTAPGMNTPGMVFRCKNPGCTAPPFQTQYLLNSHMNVHSSSRPHYCPRKGCPRGEGGKGFKRKNEMIRHGLVHQSPGYACPFCPDREHKYPRPDNLQRHVKVHHLDKDKDDPVLREVLNQRLDGGSRGRRRRANS